MRNYEYDGSCGAWTQSAAKAGNIFTAEGSTDAVETVDAVSFATADADVPYMVKVYTGVRNANPESGTLTETKSGTTTYAGYYTVKLDRPVQVDKGERFSVVIEAEGGCNFFADYSYSEGWAKFTSASAAGQSFYNRGSRWVDAHSSGMVMRIKAFTDLKSRLDGKSVSADAIADRQYTGSAITPEVVLKNAATGKELIKGTDYTVGYADNVNAGIADIVCTGMNSYAGTLTIHFGIKAVTLSESAAIEPVMDQRYMNGTAVRPDVVMHNIFSGARLINNRDYRLSYADNTDVGTATVMIAGAGNYSGSVSADFTISGNAVDLAGYTVSVDEAVEYTGSARRPVYVNGLSEGTDYKVSYSGNVDAGTASYVITGIKPGYTGSISGNFVIEPAEITDAMVSRFPDQAYTRPDVTVTFGGRILQKNRDYSVTSGNDISGSANSISINGIGNFSSSVSRTYYLLAAPKAISLNSFTVDISGYAFDSIADRVYSGSRQTVKKLSHNLQEFAEDRDYTAVYADNVNAGTASMVIVGGGRYKGVRKLTFRIKRADIKDADITVEKAVYTGYAVKPDVTVMYAGMKLRQGIDYTLSYAKNVKASDAAAVSIKGKGNFAGTQTGKFRIYPLSLSGNEDVRVAARISSSRTVFTVKCGNRKLVNGKDYELKYDNSIVTVKGLNNYTGSYSRKCENKVMDISAAAYLRPVATQYYTGYAVKPAVRVAADAHGEDLVEGEDYTLSYANNTNITKGRQRARVTVKFMGEYKGSISETFMIAAIDLADADFSAADVMYSGRQLRPDVTASYCGSTLRAGAAYRLTYAAAKSTGQSNVTVRCIKGRTQVKSSDTGTIPLPFNVLSANLAASTVKLKNNIIKAKLNRKTGKYEAVPMPASVKIGTNTYRYGTDYKIYVPGDDSYTLPADAAAGTTGISFIDIVGTGNCYGSVRCYYAFRK